MTLTVSLLLKANATQAKAEVRTMHDELRQLNIQTDGNKAQQFVNAWAGVKPVMSSAEQSARALGDALDLQDEFNRLRQATDPAYAATVRFAQAQDLATRAVKAGAIAQADASAVMKRLGGTSVFTGNSMRMMSQQLSQVGQQTMATGNFVQALAIQLPDIGVGFGTIGAAAGLLAGIALPMVISAFMGTASEAKETADLIDDLEAAVTKYSASAKNAMKPTSELAKEYGNLASKAKDAFKAIAEADRQSALANLKDTKNAIAETFGSLDPGIVARFATPSAVAITGIQQALGSTKAEAGAVFEALSRLSEAQGPVQIADAAAKARDALLAAGVAANDPLVQGLNAAWSEALNLQAAASGIGDAAAAAVAKTTAEYQAQAAMQALIAQYGEASLQVATAKAQADRDAVIASEDYVNATDEAKTALLAAYDAANAIASVDIAGNVTLAANAAGVLAANLATAMSKLEGIRREQARNSEVVFDPRDSRYDKGKADLARIAMEPHRTETAASMVKPVKATGGGGGGRGAGADEAKKEAQAVSDLIKKLEDEQAVLRESDPVKQELLKHRKELAAASQTERKKIEELIRAEVQLKSVREATDFMASTALDALKGIVAGGDEATNAMKRLADSILDAALQAVWLGEGPLAGVLGISGSLFGAIFGGKAGAGIPAKAEGGMLFGEGSGRADKLPLWGSAGEFMVNARATARHRPLLERINNGQPIPGFAAGGALGGQRSGDGGGAGASKLEQHIHLYSATGNTEIQEMVAQGVQTGLDLHDREVLPGRVKGILQDPRRSGR